MNTEFKILNMNQQVLKYIDETLFEFYKEKNADQIALLINKDEKDKCAKILSILPIYIDDINDIDNKLTVYIGYAYSTDDKVAEILLKNLINYFKITGTEKIIGPIEKDIWYESSIKTFNNTFFPAEPPIHISPNAYERVGFKPKFKYHSYKQINLILGIPNTKKPKIRYETIEEIPTDQELKEIYNVINLSYQQNNFFKEINYNKTNDYQNFYNKFHRFYGVYFLDVKVAKFMDEIIGVIIGYTRTNEEYVIRTVAVHPNFQNNNIGLSLFNQLCNEKYIQGYEKIIYSMITNKKLEEKIKNKFNPEKISTYCLYELNI